MWISNFIITAPVYIVMTLMTILCCGKAEKYTDALNVTRRANVGKAKFYFFSLLTIIIPCIVAGLRSESIGTDVTVYAKQMTTMARYCNSIPELLVLGKMEIGYTALVFAATKMFGTLSAVLFFTEFFILLPVYASAYRCRDKMSMQLFLFAFLCMDYIATFNVMRQSISAAFCMLALFEIIDRKVLRGIFACIVALLFHSTAIIGIVVVFLGWSICKSSNNVRYGLKVAVIVGLAVAILSWETLATWMLNKGLVPESFSRYLSLFGNIDKNMGAYFFEINFSSYIELIFRLLCYFLPIIVIGKKNIFAKNGKYGEIMEMISLLGVVIYSFVFILFHSVYGYRITMYMEYFFIPWIGVIDSLGGKSRLIKLRSMPIKRLIIVLFLIFYWFFGYMILGWHNTFPFRFS